MDPIGDLGQRKSVSQASILDEEANRDQEMAAIVQRARKLRPRRRYPTTKVAAITPPSPAVPLAGAANAIGGAPKPAPAPAAPPPPAAPSAIAQGLPKPAGGMGEAGNAVSAPAAPAAPAAAGHGFDWSSIGPMLQHGGQWIANLFGQQAGNWYGKQSPGMQQYGMPLGGGIGAMLAMYLLHHMFRGGQQKQAADGTPGDNPWLRLLMEGGGSVAGSGVLGAGIGSVLGTGAGAARGNAPEGIGRGLIRGGMTGGGAALGAGASPIALAAIMKMLGGNAGPDMLRASSGVGAGLGALGGWGLSGNMLGPPEAERDEHSQLRKAAADLLNPQEEESERGGEDAWQSVPGGMPSVKNFAPFEHSNSF